MCVCGIGEFVDSKTKDWLEIRNPATQELESRVPMATHDEMRAAVSSAHNAFKSWRNTPVSSRQRVLFELQHLVRKHSDEIAHEIVRENGKTLNDARGDVFRGLEVVEYSTGVARDMMVQYIGNIQ